MTAATIEIVDLTEIVGEMPLACEYGDRPWHSGDGPAEWVMVTVTCACGASALRLACSVCKDALLGTVDAVCCAGCRQFVWAPARTAFSRIEAL